MSDSTEGKRLTANGASTGWSHEYVVSGELLTWYEALVDLIPHILRKTRPR